MKQQKWNNYFYSHYRPEGNEWGIKDLEKYRLWYSSWLHLIKSRFHLHFNDKKTLELGCGIGALSTLLHDEGAQATGTDIAEIMVEHAQRLSPTIPFRVYDVTRSFPTNDTFNFIFAFEVLEHIPQLDLALSNIYNLLDKNGYFIASTPYPYKKNMIDPTHVNVHLPEFWQTTIESYGFSKVTCLPLSFPPLIWRIPPFINPIIHRYIPLKGFVSTTLIVAKK